MVSIFKKKHWLFLEHVKTEERKVLIGLKSDGTKRLKALNLHSFHANENQNQNFKSKSDFHFPMPMAMMSPLYSLLGSASRFQDSQPLSLSLINQSSLCSLCSLISLVSLVSRVDFKISLFYFETNKVLYIKIFLHSTGSKLSCWLLLSLTHTTLDIAASLCSHHGSS